MKLTELTSFISNFEKRYEEINDKYIKKLKKLEEDRKNLLSAAQSQSEKYIKDTKDKIDKEIAEIEKTMRDKLKDLDSQIKSWIDIQKEKIENSILTALKARLGIDIDIDIKDIKLDK